MRPEVLLVTQEFPVFRGGVATYCHRLAAHLTAAGHPVGVVAPRAGVGDDTLDRAAPFPVWRYRDGGGIAGRQLARGWAVLRAAWRLRPAVLWAADWRMGALAAPVARLLRRPLVVTVYGSEVLMATERPLRRRLARWVYRRAARVFPISRYVAGLLEDRGVPADRIRRVPLGVDTGPAKDPAALDERAREIRRELGVGDDPCLLTLARLTPRKGQDVMLRALAEVLPRRPRAVYVVAGAGPDRERLEALARELGVAHRVVFAGEVAEEDKAAYYRMCDVFVTLSRRQGYLVEGFGLTLLEAAMRGRPVVAGRHGGVPDTVVDGETGLLVDPTDPAAAAAAVLRLLENPEQAARMGRAGRRRAEEVFTWSAMAEAYAGHLRPWLAPHAEAA